MDDFSKNLLKDIPEGFARDEVIREMQQRRTEQPDNELLSALASTAVFLGINSARDATEHLEKLNKMVGSDYPTGTLVIAGAMLAASAALVRIHIDQYKGSEKTVAAAAAMNVWAASYVVLPQVKAALEKLYSGKLENGVHDVGGMTMGVWTEDRKKS